ncbi:MAG: radical SAM protein [Candidatus Omnitrophota bacterium]
MPYPFLIAAKKNKEIFDIPGYIACGMSGNCIIPLSVGDLIPLPKQSRLFFLPDRYPVAFDPGPGQIQPLKEFYPVAAFLPPGYTGLSCAAYQERAGARVLPLFSYAAVALYKGKYYVAATLIDRHKKHDLSSVDWHVLKNKINFFKGRSNRLIRHLAVCALKNCCPNAVNFFLGKFECPLPSSRLCNARCIGCISFQPRYSCPATQERLKFAPTAQELAEIALIHIRRAKNPIVSFGQGCEGEPLLSGKAIVEAIKAIRGQTQLGTIHMNTNASLPGEVRNLCVSGLDSMRVSLNSARRGLYKQYYQPKGYSFDDVVRSIAIAKKNKKFVSLNYLVMPGFTDEYEEFRELVAFIRNTGIDMIQWRNLNFDPLRYFAKMKIIAPRELLGVNTVINQLRSEFPGLKHGYFNLSKEDFVK